MKKLLLALILAGCGGRLPGDDVQPPVVTVSTVDPFDCRLDADQQACHCTIPEYSSQAIADSSTRCDFLRAVAAGLY